MSWPVSLLEPRLCCTGKTTLLRDVTCQLADAFSKLVMVVDTSEEIAGGGNVPHACIGSARRMLGGAEQSKYEVLQEAVANHGPEVYLCAEACTVTWLGSQPITSGAITVNHTYTLCLSHCVLHDSVHAFCDYMLRAADTIAFEMHRSVQEACDT